MPEDGVSLSAFSLDCLSVVLPADYVPILRALKGKGLIYPVRDGAAWRVFPRKPEGRRFEPKPADDLAVFMRSAVPHMMRIAEIEQAVEDERERRLREVEAVRLLSKLARRYVDRGLSLGTMRAAMWRVFSAESMAVLAKRERLFVRESTVDGIRPATARRRNLPRGLPPLERIVKLVERAGQDGVNKNDLLRSFPIPRPRADTLGEMIAGLEESGMLRTMTGRYHNRGKPALRVFPPNARPRLLPDGTFARADL